MTLTIHSEVVFSDKEVSYQVKDFATCNSKQIALTPNISYDEPKSLPKTFLSLKSCTQHKISIIALTPLHNVGSIIPNFSPSSQPDNGL